MGSAFSHDEVVVSVEGAATTGAEDTPQLPLTHYGTLTRKATAQQAMLVDYTYVGGIRNGMRHGHGNLLVLEPPFKKALKFHLLTIY